MSARRGKPRRHNTKHTCNGKVRFRDDKEALRALHLIQNYSERSKVAVRCYSCPRCKGVHLTTMERYVSPPLPPDVPLL